MREIATEELVVGTTAMLKIGSPVRQWLRVVRGGRKPWLTPSKYLPPQYYSLEREDLPQYVEVGIGALMLPYAIVYHHDGRDWVRLWIDTRKVVLYRPE